VNVKPGGTYSDYLTLNTKPACRYAREMNDEKHWLQVLTRIASQRQQTHYFYLPVSHFPTLPPVAATVQAQRAVPQVK